MKTGVVFAAVVVLLAAATSAQAGFVSINVTAPDNPDGLIGVSINHDVGDGTAAVGLGEVFEPEQMSLRLLFDGETDEDPVMSVTKVIENTTGFEWVGYRLDLDVAGVATFTGTPVSNAFTFNPGASDNKSLVFDVGSLPSGQSATFAVDILVPTTGPFGFTLTQTPAIIPEPTTLLLGLLVAGSGAVVTLRRRWG